MESYTTSLPLVIEKQCNGLFVHLDSSVCSLTAEKESKVLLLNAIYPKNHGKENNLNSIDFDARIFHSFWDWTKQGKRGRRGEVKHVQHYMCNNRINRTMKEARKRNGNSEMSFR